MRRNILRKRHREHLKAHASPEVQAEAEALPDEPPEMTKEEMIDLLSEMHHNRTRNVGNLCGDSFHCFDMSHPKFLWLFALQPRLFEFCPELRT